MRCGTERAPLRGAILLLLVTCAPIEVGESVRVHYGDAYDRTWVPAPPGRLRREDTPREAEIDAFLAKCAVEFDEVRTLCYAEDGGRAREQVPRLPLRKPPTRVDFSSGCAPEAQS